MKTILIIGLFCLATLGAQTAAYPGRVPSDSDLLVAGDNLSTTLTAAATATSGALFVKSTAGFAANMAVTVDDEIIRICDVTSVSLIVCPSGRGFTGRSPKPHNVNSTVKVNYIAWHHNSLSLNLQAMGLALGPNLSNVEKPLTFADPLVRNGNTVSCLSCSLGPSVHASTHGLSGSDPVSLDASQITGGTILAARLPALGASGSSHATGLVPDPGASAGTTRYLREDGTWTAIAGSNASQLQGRTLASTAPTDAQTICWSISGNQWQPCATMTWATLPGAPSLGSVALLNVGTTAGTVATGNHDHTGVYEPANANIQSHIGITAGNPHGTTKNDVGLGNVLNVDITGWAGSANITTVGTITTGTVPLARLSGVTPAAIGAIPTTAIGQPNGVVGLDANGNATIGATVVDAAKGVLIPVTISTTSPVTVAPAGLYWNNSAGAMTFTLPAITSGLVGMKFCFGNDDAKMGVITIQAPSGTKISMNGVASTSATGAIASGGAVGDAACVIAYSTTVYKAFTGSGSWTNN